MLHRGENQQALDLTTNRLKTYPQDCRLYSLQGIAAMGLGHRTDALQAFDHALSLCPRDLAALEGAGQLHYSQHDKSAIPLLERVLALQPDNQPAHAMLASSLRDAGRCREALPHFAASQSAFSQKPEWLEGDAGCLALTGQYAKALALYKQLEALQPGPTYLYNIAWLEARTGDDRAALTTLEPIFKQDKSSPAFSFGSYLAERLGDTPRAVALLRSAIVLAPDNVQNYLDFANIAFTHKSFSAGIAMIDSGLSRLPDSAPLYLARGILKAQLTGQTASAIEDFQHAHKLDPQLSLSVDALGIVRTQEHNNADSRAIFEEQIRLHPDDPVLHYLLAEQLSQAAGSNATQQAIQTAKQATVLDPNYVPARDLLAKLYLRANLPALAAAEADHALKSDPNDQEALYQKLIAMRRLGNHAAVAQLTHQFETLRARNAEHQRTLDRFRLDAVTGAP